MLAHAKQQTADHPVVGQQAKPVHPFHRAQCSRQQRHESERRPIATRGRHVAFPESATTCIRNASASVREAASSSVRAGWSRTVSASRCSQTSRPASAPSHEAGGQKSEQHQTGQTPMPCRENRIRPGQAEQDRRENKFHQRVSGPRRDSVNCAGSICNWSTCGEETTRGRQGPYWYDKINKLRPMLACRISPARTEKRSRHCISVIIS